MERFSVALDVGLVGGVLVDPAILGLFAGGLLVLLGKGVPRGMRHVQDGLFFVAIHIVLVDPFDGRLLSYRRLVRPTQFELFLRSGKVNVRPRISRKVGMRDIIRLTERKLGGLMDPLDGVHVDVFEIVIQGHPQLLGHLFEVGLGRFRPELLLIRGSWFRGVRRPGQEGGRPRGERGRCGSHRCGSGVVCAWKGYELACLIEEVQHGSSCARSDEVQRNDGRKVQGCTGEFVRRVKEDL